MGLGGIGIWQLLILLAIIVMVFGTSRLRNVGSDLGRAITGFPNSMSMDAAESDSGASNTASQEESDSDKPAT